MLFFFLIEISIFKLSLRLLETSKQMTIWKQFTCLHAWLYIDENANYILSAPQYPSILHTSLSLQQTEHILVPILLLLPNGPWEAVHTWKVFIYCVWLSMKKCLQGKKEETYINKLLANNYRIHEKGWFKRIRLLHNSMKEILYVFSAHQLKL